MKASVILSYLDSERTLPECLRRLGAQDYHDYEIIALNDKEHHDCTEVEGQNLGIEQATGDVLFFTNSDIFVSRDWISSHMKHYPRIDMVLGASPHLPMHGLTSLSFTNFSAKKSVLKRYPLRETLHQDLDFSARIFKGRDVSWTIDNSIRVTTDDGDITGEKAFRYLMNITILYKRYGILPLPPAVPFTALKKALDRPEKLLGILAGLMAPVDHPLGRRTIKQARK